MSNTITRTVFYRTLNVGGLEIFYREAGPRDAPTVLLLHARPRWWVGLGCVSAVVCGLCYLVSGLDYMAQFIGCESLRFRETKQCCASSHETCSSEWVLLCCHM
jgi:hypothetical protein